MAVLPRRNTHGAAAGVSLARVLSKLGYCSRTQAVELIEAGRVSVNARVVRNAAQRVDMQCDVVRVDGQPLSASAHSYLALNKPRGLVTTASDERGRATVYDCLPEQERRWLAPVGRLDKASEGLLLFSNDTRWAARLLDPASHLPKVYHVQIDRLPGEDDLARMRAGVLTKEGERLAVDGVSVLRRGEKHGWLEITLHEGKNRQIRRVLEALDVAVLRLVRVAIGPVRLGELAKGQWRALTAAELAGLDRLLQPKSSKGDTE